MTIITIAKAKESINEHIDISNSNISLSEKIVYNDCFNNEESTVDDSLPFVLRRIISKGVIPIYNEKTSYDTRIITDKTILGIDINSSKIQHLFELQKHKGDSFNYSKIFNDDLKSSKTIDLTDESTEIIKPDYQLPYKLILRDISIKNDTFDYEDKEYENLDLSDEIMWNEIIRKVPYETPINVYRITNTRYYD